VRLAVPESTLARLRQAFPDVRFVAADDAASLARDVGDADVYYGFTFPTHLLPAATRLRWIQCITAGVDPELAAAVRGGDIVVTNGAGIAAGPIAEHALAGMLALARNLPTALRLQADARWDRLAVMSGTGSGLRELGGSAVAILGLGPIGRAVARAVAAFGATVRGVRRRPELGAPPPLEAVVGPGELRPLLAWADFVVVAVPETPATDGLIGAAELAAMRPSAYLVNVARGAVIDEEALVAALRRGGIAGAALDVFTREPLPAESPLWTLQNVIVTPHVAGATPHYFERALDLFVDNLERWRAGRRLRNAVDLVLGYPSEV
jgi:phosphoglycerate dehydrogenase-like enzyme